MKDAAQLFAEQNWSLPSAVDQVYDISESIDPENSIGWKPAWTFPVLLDALRSKQGDMYEKAKCGRYWINDLIQRYLILLHYSDEMTWDVGVGVWVWVYFPSHYIVVVYTYKRISYTYSDHKTLYTTSKYFEPGISFYHYIHNNSLIKAKKSRRRHKSSHHARLYRCGD